MCIARDNLVNKNRELKLKLQQQQQQQQSQSQQFNVPNNWMQSVRKVSTKPSINFCFVY